MCILFTNVLNRDHVPKTVRNRDHRITSWRLNSNSRKYSNTRYSQRCFGHATRPLSANGRTNVRPCGRASESCSRCARAGGGGGGGGGGDEVCANAGGFSLGGGLTRNVLVEGEGGPLDLLEARGTRGTPTNEKRA